MRGLTAANLSKKYGPTALKLSKKKVRPDGLEAAKLLSVDQNSKKKKCGSIWGQTENTV